MKIVLLFAGILGVIIGLGLWKDAEKDYVNNTGVSCSSFSSDLDCAVLKVENMDDKKNVSVFIMVVSGGVALVSGVLLSGSVNTKTDEKDNN